MDVNIYTVIWSHYFNVALLATSAHGCVCTGFSTQYVLAWHSTLQDTRASLLGYSTSVACRGLMHSSNPLHHSTSGGKWRPLHKPQWTAVNKQVR